MEDLVRSLRTLGLRPPSGSLLVDLLEADADPEAQKRLADRLALEKLQRDVDDGEDPEGAGEDGDDDEDDVFITPDVVRGALLSLLDSFSRTLARARDLHKREYAAYKAAGARPVKAVPRTALLTRQSSDIRRAQEEYDAVFARTEGTEKGSGPRYRPEPIPRLILEGAPHFTSTRPLEELERMSIADFQAPRRFEGRFLLCRVISKPLVYVGCTLIVDDPSGAATPLSIAHFTSQINLPPTSPEVAALLPIGTILAIREPYISSNHYISAGGPVQGKAATGVRVSSPTDIIVIEQDDALLQDVAWAVPLKDLLDEGREEPEPHIWMREGPCSRVVRSNKGSRAPATTTPSPQSTITEVRRLLEAGQPGAAHRELAAARRLGVLGTEQSIVDVEARVLHSLRAYDGLQTLSRRCAEEGTVMPTTQAEILQRTSLFRSETSSPHPSTSTSLTPEPTQALVQALYKLDRTPTELSPVPELYGQDYISPALAIAPIEGAGRGLLTTRDVEPGELLLCCNAVEPCFAEDPRWAGVQVLRLGLSVEHGGDGARDGADGVSVTTTQVMACTRLVHALVDRPELCHAVLGLTAGPALPYSSFAQSETYPLITEAVLDPVRSVDDYRRPGIDAHYIDGVLQHNAFGPGRDVEVDQYRPIPLPGLGAQAEQVEVTARPSKRWRQRPPPAESDVARASMPHPLPAILNHRCIPNVSSVFLGSNILTRALVALPKGTEIVHQYVSGERPFFIRSAQLAKHGFVCACALCVLERGEEESRPGAVRRRVEARDGKMAPVLERARMLFKNRLAGLVDASQAGGAEEAEADVVRALRGIVDEIEGTYSLTRGSLQGSDDEDGTTTSWQDKVILKPELFDPLVMLARLFRRSSTTWWLAVQCELKALRSVGAILNPRWLSNDQGAIQACQGQELQPVLRQAPVLRLVDSQRALLRVARTLRRQCPTEPKLALLWVDASYLLSSWMLGGGIEVYQDMMLRARRSDEWERYEREDPSSDKAVLGDDAHAHPRSQAVGLVVDQTVLEEWLANRQANGSMQR